MAANKSGVLLTFDDGFANNFSNALPVLQKVGAPALFFVSTQHVASPRDWLGFVRVRARGTWGAEEAVPDGVAADWYDGMSTDELRRCSDDSLITIGAHGVSHAILTECTDQQLAAELVEARGFLEAVTSRQIEYFAYPRGDYDLRVVRQVQAAGYRAAFTIDPVGVGLAQYELPRIGIYRVGRGYLSLKLSGLHRRPLSLRRP